MKFIQAMAVISVVAMTSLNASGHSNPYLRNFSQAIIDQASDASNRFRATIEAVRNIEQPRTGGASGAVDVGVAQVDEVGVIQGALSDLDEDTRAALSRPHLGAANHSLLMALHARDEMIGAQAGMELAGVLTEGMDAPGVSHVLHLQSEFFDAAAQVVLHLQEAPPELKELLSGVLEVLREKMRSVIELQVECIRRMGNSEAVDAASSENIGRLRSRIIELNRETSNAEVAISELGEDAFEVLAVLNSVFSGGRSVELEEPLIADIEIQGHNNSSS